MPDDLFALGGGDVDRIFRMLDEWEGVRLRQVDPQRRAGSPARVSYYLGLTTGLVTGRSAAVLGSGPVTIYRAEEMTDGRYTLVSADSTETAYNTCTTAIPSGWLVDLDREPTSGRLLAKALCVYVTATGSGGSGGDTVTAGCGNCTTELQTYCVRFAGVTSLLCDDCVATFDRDIELTFDPMTGVGVSGPCRWVAAFSLCVGGSFSAGITFFYDETDLKWKLWNAVTNAGGVIMEYEASLIASAAWDCDSPLTLTLVRAGDSGGACANWPATITVQACGGGGGGGGAISSTAIGSTSSKTPGLTLTLAHGVTIPAGTTLLVPLAYIASGFTTPTILAGSDSMTLVYHQGNSTSGTSVFKLTVTSDITGDIVATFSGNFDAAVMSAEYVSNLPNNIVGSPFHSNGTSTTPGVAATAGANTYLFAAVGTNGPVGDLDGAWQNGLSDGFQDDGTTGGAANTNVRLCTGHIVNATPFSATAGKTGITSRDWGIVVVPCS